MEKLTLVETFSKVKTVYKSTRKELDDRVTVKNTVFVKEEGDL